MDQCRVYDENFGDLKENIRHMKMKGGLLSTLLCLLDISITKRLRLQAVWQETKLLLCVREVMEGTIEKTLCHTLCKANPF